eukprot:6210704-Pleurochrysis_carterae.AAC.1
MPTQSRLNSAPSVDLCRQRRQVRARATRGASKRAAEVTLQWQEQYYKLGAAYAGVEMLYFDVPPFETSKYIISAIDGCCLKSG